MSWGKYSLVTCKYKGEWTSDRAMKVPSCKVIKKVEGGKIWNLPKEMRKRKTFKHREKMKLLELQNIFLTFRLGINCNMLMLNDILWSCQAVPSDWAGDEMPAIHLGACWTCRTSGPTPDLLNQKLNFSRYPVIYMHINIWEALVCLLFAHFSPFYCFNFIF